MEDFMIIDQSIKRINKKIRDIKEDRISNTPKNLLSEDLDYKDLQFINKFLIDMITIHFQNNKWIQLPYIYSGSDKIISVEWSLKNYEITSRFDPSLDYISVHAVKLNDLSNSVYENFSYNENLIDKFAEFLRKVI